MQSNQIDHHFNRLTGMFYMATPHRGVPIEQIEETLAAYHRIVSEWKREHKTEVLPECTS